MSTKPDPTYPVPPLIGDGTPIYPRIVICSNGEPANLPLLFAMHWAGDSGFEPFTIEDSYLPAEDRSEKYLIKEITIQKFKFGQVNL
jgi:hypothetical protein